MMQDRVRVSIRARIRVRVGERASNRVRVGERASNKVRVSVQFCPFFIYINTLKNTHNNTIRQFFYKG